MYIKLVRNDMNLEEDIDVLSWKEGGSKYSINGISIPARFYQEIIHEKQLIQITDLIGRQVNIHNNQNILIYIYNDGSTEKMFKK